MRSCVDRSHAAEVLKDGDLILAVDDQPVTSYRHVESIIAAQRLITDLEGSADGSTAQMHGKLSAGCSIDTQENSMHVAGLATKIKSPACKAAVLSPRLMHAAMQDKAKQINSPRESSTALISAGKCQTSASEEKNSLGVRPSIRLTIFRDAAVEHVKVQLGLEDGLGTRRLVHWCGALLQVISPFVMTCVASARSISQCIGVLLTFDQPTNQDMV